MSDLFTSAFTVAYWCIVQVAAISLAGILIASMVRKHRPATACAVLSVTVCLITLFTVTVMLPIDTWTSRAVGLLEETVNANGNLPRKLHGNSQVAETVGPKSIVPVVSVTAADIIAAARRFSLTAEIPRKARQSWLTAAGWATAIALLIGGLGLLSSIMFVARTRRRGVAIDDGELRLLVEGLSHKIQCDAVSVRESSYISSAAVAGFIWPVVILPCNWRQWDAGELQSVLAHELAHVARRDSTWRMAACVIQAIHFFNPLVHRLLNRLVLYQELAADQIAANAVGQRRYLRSLTTLALQQDQFAGHGCPAVMPVFTGHLTRRIKMLNSMDGSQKISPRKTHCGFAVAAIATLGLLIAVLPGFAQTKPDEKSKPINEVVVANSADLSPTTIGSSSFQRPALHPAMVADNDNGMVLVRVSELMKHPLTKKLKPLVDYQVIPWAVSLFPTLDAEQIDFSGVEWAAGQVIVTIDRNVETPESGKHLMQLGANGLTVRFHDDVNLETWMNQYSPGLFETKVVDGQDVFITALPLLSNEDARCRFQQTGPRTIRIGSTENRSGSSDDAVAKVAVSDATKSVIRSVSLSRDRKSATKRWHQPWKELSTGLVSIAFTDANIRTAVHVEESGDELNDGISHLIAVLLQRCTTFGYAVDLDKNCDATIQSRLTHGSVAKAELSATEMRRLQRLLGETGAVAKLTAESKGLPLQLISEAAQAFAKATIVVTPNADESADLVVTAVMPIDINTIAVSEPNEK